MAHGARDLPRRGNWHVATLLPVPFDRAASRCLLDGCRDPSIQRLLHSELKEQPGTVGKPERAPRARSGPRLPRLPCRCSYR